MGVGVEVCLGNAVAAALHDDGEAVDPDRPMAQELPGDLPRAVGAGRQARRVCGYEKDAQYAGAGSDGHPYPQGNAEAVPVKQRADQERTDRAHDVLAGKHHAVRDGAVAGGEPLAQGQGRRAVYERASQRGQDSLRGDQVPDVCAVRRQEEAEAGDDSATQSSRLTIMSPSLGEEGEQKGHRHVHHAVGGGADDTGCLLVALQCPVARVVLLEDSVTHCKS